MPCVVLGSAYGRSLSATLGRLGGMIEIAPGGLPVRAHRVLAPIYPGDSGGLVLDGDGRFVGMITGVSAPRRSPVLDAFGEIDLGAEDAVPAGSTGFAVPARECERAWQDLGRFGRMRRGYLGIQIMAAADDRGGARVLQVTPGGPADRAGLRPGDLVTAFGELFVTGGKQLCALVAATAPDETVDVGVRRGERDLHLEVLLGTARKRPGLHQVPLAHSPDSAAAPAPVRPVAEARRGSR